MTQVTPVGRPLRPSGKLLQEDARRHHRALLLQALFRDGPASRADLARATGLTRVTVSDLVGEMVAEKLVEELGAPVESRVGKPPTLVGVAADSTHIVALDLSPDDRMLGAVVNLAGAGHHPHRAPAEGSARQGRARPRARARRRPDRPGHQARPRHRGRLARASSTPAASCSTRPTSAGTAPRWPESLRSRTGVPVFVANDANTAALGEHTYGEADGGGTDGAADRHRCRRRPDPRGLAAPRPPRRRGRDRPRGRGPARRAAVPAAAPAAWRPSSPSPTCAGGWPRRHRRSGCSATPASASGAALAPVIGTLNLHELVLSGPTELLDGALRDAVEKTIRRPHDGCDR